MLKGGPLRILAGCMFGLAGGSSLVTAVFPFATARLLQTESFDMSQIFRYTLPIVVLWIIGGALVGWQGGKRTGILAFGACGALGGFILSVFAVSGNVSFVVGGTLIGLAYGAIGGLIIGAAFSNTDESQEE